MRTHLRTAIGITLVACAFATGCDDRETFTKTPSSTSTSPTAQTASLTKVQTCDELATLLKADAAAKLNAAIDEQIQQVKANGAAYAGGDGVVYANASMGTAEASAKDARATATASPTAPSTTGGATTAGSQTAAPAATSTPSATSYSTTNTQVNGVDEADIVETDGTYLYVLHGSEFLVVKALPAADLSLATRTRLEGNPAEMFVADGYAVVFSSVNGAPVYKAAGVTPKSAYEDRVAYAVSAVAAPAGAVGGSGTSTAADTFVYAPLTKVTVLKLDGTSAAVRSELYFEGDYSTARRVGTQIRTVLNGGSHGPVVPSWPTFADANAYPKTTEGWVAAFEKTRKDGLALVAASTVNDWLPYTFTKNGDNVTAQPLACSSYYVPGSATTAYGLVQVQSFDVTAPTNVSSAAIAGRSDVVYANANALYVTTSAWTPIAVGPMPLGVPVAVSASGSATSTSVGSSGGGAVAVPERKDTPVPVDPAPVPLPPEATVTLTKTHIHKFAFAGNEPSYEGSGTVAGAVQNQFSLDEHNGFLRVTTTEDRVSPTYSVRGRVNHLFVLGLDNHQLNVVGDSGDLAPQESIFSTRFVGDRAYVVTFLRKDPLFVIDVADPKAPRVLGHLTIPGFSEYMHPLDDGHLLTIGQDTNAQGQATGLALQLFDVTNPLAPKLAETNPPGKAKFVFNATDYGYSSSEAQYNHKAFTYFAEKKLLSFPLTGGATTSNGQYKPVNALEVFAIDVTSGIRRIGDVDHSSFASQVNNGGCGSWYSQPTVRRGVFLDNLLYSISTGGIKVNRVEANALGSISSLELPTPAFDPVYPVNNVGVAVDIAMPCVAPGVAPDGGKPM